MELCHLFLSHFYARFSAIAMSFFCRQVFSERDCEGCEIWAEELKYKTLPLPANKHCSNSQELLEEPLFRFINEQHAVLPSMLALVYRKHVISFPKVQSHERNVRLRLMCSQSLDMCFSCIDMNVNVMHRFINFCKMCYSSKKKFTNCATKSNQQNSS
jgi:hypothetical protein